jgi:hypothetical protein
MATYDNLKLLIATLKNIGLFDRVFRWGKIKNLLIDAASDLKINESKLNEQLNTTSSLTSQLQLLDKEKQLLDKRKNQIENELEILRRETDRLQKENTIFITTEESRKQSHHESLGMLQKIQTQIQTERAGEMEEKNRMELQRLANLKQTWINHETNVKTIVKSIAQRHTIDYIEKAPFKGTPDNTLFICEEYIVFDAKSPAGDDLKNFPAYIKDQAERAQKYAKQPDVKPEIFFIVPFNTLQILRQFVFKFPDYTVYILSVDGLEPLILNLKKIEEYEFAKELTPEDRNNICRVLGRFAHLSKRRIQIDSFFARQFIELAYKAESSLPADILESVMEFERSEKLNPPQEKRAKAIAISELEKEANQVKQDAGGRGIVMEDNLLTTKLNNHPLYKDQPGEAQ